MGLLKALSTGQRKVESIPLIFQASGQDWVLPTVSSGKVDGGTNLTWEQGIEQMKKMIPSSFIGKGPSSQNIQEIYPGIKQGESVYDYLQRTSDFTGQYKSALSKAKEFVTNPQAVSKDYVMLNGVMTNSKTASDIMALSESELKAQLASDQALATKMQGEQKANIQIQKEAEAGPLAEQAAKGKASATSGFTDKSTQIKQKPDGSYQVIKALTGEILADNIKDLTAALSTQQQITGGSTPQPTAGLSEAGSESASVIADIASQDENILQKILQGIPVTPEDIQAALVSKRALAKAEFDPYYKQKFQRAQEDFTLSLQYEAEQRKLQETQQQLQDEIQKEQLSGTTAEQGLSQSGVRQKLEQRLAQQQENVARSQRMQFARQQQLLGRQAEEYLGSSNLQGLNLPNIEGGFTPSGGVKGSLEAEQTTAIEQRAQELLKKENLLSASAIPGAPVDLITQLI